MYYRDGYIPRGYSAPELKMSRPSNLLVSPVSRLETTKEDEQ